MTSQDKKRILMDYLKLKTEEEDWNAVITTSIDLKGLKGALSLSQPSEMPYKSKESKIEAYEHPAAKAIDPNGLIGVAKVTEEEIPHHVNEVRRLLRLSDNELVDRLFPEEQVSA